MAAPNLGWLADLVAQLLYRNGVAQASRRAWNLSTRFLVTDSPANQWTTIDVDGDALAAQTDTLPAPVDSSTPGLGASSNGLARADHVHALGSDPALAGDSAALLSYDASALSSGSAYGLIVDEATAQTGGTHYLASFRRLGAERIRIASAGSGTATLSVPDTLVGYAGTEPAGSSDILPLVQGQGIRRYLRSYWIETVAASATFDLEIDATLFDPALTGYAIIMAEAKIMGYRDTGAHNSAIVRGLFRTSEEAITLTESGVEYQAGTNDDTLAFAVDAGQPILEITNNHSSARTYSVMLEILATEAPTTAP